MVFLDKKDIEYKDFPYFHIPAIFDAKLLFPDSSKKFNRLSIYDLIKLYAKKDINFVVYGCPCSCTWNGGRYMTSPVYKVNIIKRMFSKYINDLGMDIQITFTNSLLEERDTYDRLGNAILKICQEFKDNCEILIVSPILEDYIRKNYPDLKLARSIINLTKPTDEDFKKYNTVVVPKWQNHDMDYLKSIVYSHKIELLVDEPCLIDCPRKSSHYETYNKNQLFIENNEIDYCNKNDNTAYNELMILPDEINDYIDIGIKHFKLSGREDIFHMLSTVSYYAIKNENVDIFTFICFENIRKIGYFDTIENMIYEGDDINDQETVS